MCRTWNEKIQQTKIEKINNNNNNNNHRVIDYNVRYCKMLKLNYHILSKPAAVNQQCGVVFIDYHNNINIILYYCAFGLYYYMYRRIGIHMNICWYARRYKTFENF